MTRTLRRPITIPLVVKGSSTYTASTHESRLCGTDAREVTILAPSSLESAVIFPTYPHKLHLLPLTAQTTTTFNNPLY